MQKKRLLVCGLGLLMLSGALAQQGKIAEKVIYKWQQDGVIYYSYIKPLGIEEFVKLDASGRQIEDFSAEFGEIEVIERKDPASASTETQEEKAESEAGGVNAEIAENEAAIAADKAAALKKRNCSVAEKNLKTLNSGEVYERDAEGNMIRLKPDEIEAKRRNVQKDIDYFCTD